MTRRARAVGFVWLRQGGVEETEDQGKERVGHVPRNYRRVGWEVILSSSLREGTYQVPVRPAEVRASGGWWGRLFAKQAGKNGTAKG